MWNIFFLNYAVYYLFFCFFIIFDIFFSISFICHFSKNSGNFYVLLFNGLEILSKIFGKSWNVFLKNIDIWNLKLFTNSISYYLFFLLAFLTPFFPTSPNQSKNSKYFCGALLYGLLILSENSQKFLIKKNRDIVNTKNFQNSIGYCLLFNFLVFLTSFFLFYLSLDFEKFLKFLCCFIVWIRDFIKKFCKTMVFFRKKIEIFEI